MNKLLKMRNGIAGLIRQDGDTGIITRSLMTDNGRGGLMPASEKEVKKIFCRVIHESPGVQRGKQWEGGLTVDKTPVVLAFHDSGLRQDDELEWRKRKYKVGVVTQDELEGKAICTQAALIEVKDG